MEHKYAVLSKMRIIVFGGRSEGIQFVEFSVNRKQMENSNKVREHIVKIEMD